MAKGKRVLDLCCYTGGFSIYAATGGAREVIGKGERARGREGERARGREFALFNTRSGVDLDEDAIKQAQVNSTLNNLTNLIR